jgi:uncharacterized protein YndB with AHSA1/START domain
MTDDTHEFTIERSFAAPAAAVFDGFLSLYDEPRPEWIVASSLDRREGGTWDVTFRPPSMEEFREHRVIEALDPPRRLEYTATIIGAQTPYDTRVIIAITPGTDDSDCRLALRQTGFPTAGLRDDFATAWPDVLDLIASRLG